MSNRIDLKEIWPIIDEVISTGGEFRLTPYGISMLPLLEPGKCEVTLVSQGEIKKGDIVKLKASANSQTIQGFVSLIIPLLGAILGFFLGGFFANKLSLNNVEMWQAIGVLLGLTITASAIFLLSKTILKFKMTEIVEVL